MYDWISHMHSHLAGVCPHQCKYCYVQKNPFGVSPRYTGALRILEGEFKVNYGSGRTIFIEHMNDMFAKEVRNEWIEKIFAHCNLFSSNNHYVFQTKNPERALEFYKYFPPNSLIGTTIETNRDTSEYSQAPLPFSRYKAMVTFARSGFSTFVTIEPIMDFDVEELSRWIRDISPMFINIGADSKKCSLPEPRSEKISQLISWLQANGITIKKKTNLQRLCVMPQRNLRKIREESDG